MREFLVHTHTEEDAEGETLRCDYYILVDQMYTSDGEVENYGVKVTSHDRPGRAGETVSIPNLTVSAARIDALAALLARNFVTPVAARDVVCDWL